MGRDWKRIYNQIPRQSFTRQLMFKHCKNNGFNLEDTHLRHLDRIEKLLAVVASALLLCFKAGEKEEKKKPTPYKKTVSAPAFCTFRRGFDFELTGEEMARLDGLNEDFRTCWDPSELV
jgi:hypothetical protein